MNSTSNNLKNISHKIHKYLHRYQLRKDFYIFWNKLTAKDRERVILLIAANNTPIPTLTHLKAELFLVKNVYGEKWNYGGIE